MNARPLTLVTADSSDLGAITPNHFLFGNQATGIPSIVGIEEFDHRKRNAHVQSYANAIWALWRKDYIPDLNPRSKWRTPVDQQLKIANIVWSIEVTQRLISYCSD